MEKTRRRRSRLGRAAIVSMTAVIIALMTFGCAGSLIEMLSEPSDSPEPDAKPAASNPEENPDGNVSPEVGRPDVDPCDGSDELEEVVRYTRPDQFPESGGSWRGVIVADNEEINPGSGYCFEDYAFGFLQPKAEDGEFNWVVVARADWETDIFPTDLECTGGDAVSLSEPPVVEEMLCTTSEGDESSSGDGSGESGTGGGTSPSDGSGEANLEQAVGDYYRAAGAEEWAYTYEHLASQTRSMFTEEEWFQKNQWLWDSNPVIYHIDSINLDSASQEPLAEVELRITAEDGSSWIQTAYFVFEDGEWKHLFSEAETDLFMPGVAFEEFVDTQTGAEGTPEGDASGACAEVSDCEVVDSADVDGDGSLDEIALVGEPDEYPAGRTQITIRVLLADGTTLTREAELEFWHSDTAWWGATDFGQIPGEELVIGGTTGAHTQWFRVLTYRDGELVELPYPESDPSGSDTFSATMWPIDAAASVYMGVQCQTDNSTVVLRSVSSVGAPSEQYDSEGVAFEGEETSWVLEGGQWRMIESSEIEYPDASSAFDIAGWQCGDLPRGYD